MDPDPLAAVRYSCVYWIDHFLDSLPQEDIGMKALEDFLRSKYLYWLEALALLRNIPKGAVDLQELERQVRKTQLATPIKDLVRDACRFVQEFADAIHDAPLQTYVSALLFSPDNSLIRQLFKKDMPKWVIIGPQLEANWRPRMLEGHERAVSSIAISCRGDRIASTSWDQSIKIWDTGSGILMRTIDDFDSHKGAVFSPLDNDKLAAYHDGGITIWDVSKGNRKKLPAQDQENRITSISLSPRRQNVLASLSSRFIELWNTDTCELIWRRPSSAHHLAFSMNDDLLACYTSDSVETLDVLTGTFIHYRDLKHIDGTCFSSKGRLLVILQNRERILFWDSMMDRMIMKLEHDKQHDAIYIRSLCFSADNSLLAASFRESSTWIWETASGNLIQKIAISCVSMAFSADKQQLFACSGSDQIFVLSVTEEDCILPTNLKETNTYGRVNFSPDATKLLIRNYLNDIMLWDSISQTSTAIPSRYYSILSPDSTRLACARESSLQIWSIDSCPPKLLFQNHFPRFFAESMSVLSQDWKQMAIASSNGTINIWDTSSGKRLWKLKEAAAFDVVLIFSSDGKRLAVIHFEPWELGIWDLTSGTRTATTIQQVTSPESFHSFAARDNWIYHLESLPSSKKTLMGIFDSAWVVRNLGLPANTSNYGFARGDTWMTNSKKRVLWLPPRYRPVSRRNWDANDRFIGIHTLQILVFEFCCNMCSAKLSNGSKEATLCKQNFTGRYKKESKKMSAGKFKAILGLFKGSDKRLIERPESY
ncbi:hypothetical protein TGAM01_v203389 [Trichoderma gamsii]|uniref:Mitochondrial division protein 1 n=1 Tax=Trichoderma gamsii TaxID=398673 RepID=A0A2P4ZTK7_9HYPO|nr:hypothetical protein TGAM01_v203389 [Trichoderma gamsii]PON27622.1 hypothetical protein TGAM01_v203389 [Trichoderma gamsii]